MKRPNLQIMGVEEGENIKTKCTDNLFNNIIVENLPKLEKESLRSRKRKEHQTIRTKKNHLRHIIIKTFSTKKKERILKAAK
jgi:hypothetical protein